MKKIAILFIVLFVLIGGITSVNAQESPVKVSQQPTYNKNSLYPILKHDILYKKRVWRRVHLSEKQNLPFFAPNNEITKIIIDAAKLKLLTPYLDDSLNKVMSHEKLIENLKIPNLGGGLTDEEKELGFGLGDDDFGDFGGSDDAVEESPEGPDLFFAKDIAILEIMEDMIFDKKRSRLYWDMQSIALIIPAEKFAQTTNLERVVAYFSFKDLVKIFREQPEKALWHNIYNDNEKRNLADALILRLFHGRIIKVSNPQDQDLAQELGSGKSPKEVLMYSQIKEHQLMEFEHNLWDY